MKAGFLLDSSALLALLRNEPGAETLLSPEPDNGSILDRSVIHQLLREKLLASALRRDSAATASVASLPLYFVASYRMAT